MMKTIISDDNKITSNWWQKTKVGDQIEGTLVSKRAVMNQLRNKEQNVYELRLANGEYWNVGGTFGIDAQMRNVKIGQIVGFKYIGDKPAKMAGFNPTKLVQVYADPSIVDEEFMKSMDEVSYPEEGEHTGTVVPQLTVVNTAADGDVTSIMAEINNIAIEKLGAKTAEEVKNKVMEATNLAFIEVNLPQILEQLKKI